jgi:hypothetical protein
MTGDPRPYRGAVPGSPADLSQLNYPTDLSARIARIEDLLLDVIKTNSAVTEKVESLHTDHRSLEKKVDNLTETVTTGKSAVRFLSWTAGIVLSIVGIASGFYQAFFR